MNNRNENETKSTSSLIEKLPKRIITHTASFLTALDRNTRCLKVNKLFDDAVIASQTVKYKLAEFISLLQIEKLISDTEVKKVKEEMQVQPLEKIYQELLKNHLPSLTNILLKRIDLQKKDFILANLLKDNLVTQTELDKHKFDEKKDNVKKYLRMTFSKIFISNPLDGANYLKKYQEQFQNLKIDVQTIQSLFYICEADKIYAGKLLASALAENFPEEFSLCLIKFGANCNQHCLDSQDYFKHAFHQAIQKNYPRVISKILESTDCLINNEAKFTTETVCRGENETTVLGEAIKVNNIHLVETLLTTYNVDPNYWYEKDLRHKRFLFPLYLAISENHFEIAKKLLAMGANPNIGAIDLKEADSLKHFLPLNIALQRLETHLKDKKSCTELLSLIGILIEKNAKVDIEGFPSYGFPLKLNLINYFFKPLLNLLESSSHPVAEKIKHLINEIIGESNQFEINKNQHQESKDELPSAPGGPRL